MLTPGYIIAAAERYYVRGFIRGQRVEWTETRAEAYLFDNIVEANAVAGEFNSIYPLQQFNARPSVECHECRDHASGHCESCGQPVCGDCSVRFPDAPDCHAGAFLYRCEPACVSPAAQGVTP